ncbi:MAG: hypothetical protein A3E82_07960 [Gammaproteobacteria bacterium RIFCSPHIGHO2_12_FULL_38_11]|nr:MAG: hypothetical protein A3E82_07960 [Gammaproteobacteria bacterium RIFCSPHIGHO2_12_FULL_38_11]
MKKELPIGKSTLEKIVTENCAYVDKTQFVAKLMKSGAYYFLSRPRRFGKSLFLDTLKQAFLGNKAVFKGLHLENHWDWDKSYPVIHFDFGTSGTYNIEEKLTETIWDVLHNCAKKYDIQVDNKDFGLAFHDLIRNIAIKTEKQVVILVDEYDKPILDVISDTPKATLIREMLKGLYTVIKVNDQYLKFVFLTGVSKFAKAGLFSGLNNLNDISLNAQYADICGYTQTDLEREFADYLQEGSVDKAKLKLWYNGYNFSGAENQKVYNPFDILLFFSNNFHYKEYWFETGSPTFLIKLIQKNQYYFPNMENTKIVESDLSSFDIDNIPLPTLLFQTGYLTIKKDIMVGTMRGFVLAYPNLEVKSSLNNKLAELGSSVSAKNATFGKLFDCLQSPSPTELGNVFRSHFASIPHDWYRNNDIQHYEGFYSSIMYSYFCALGYTVIAEDNTNTGQMDLAIILPDKILILEFKLKKNGDAASALQQIKNKKYPEKYLSHKKPIYLLGISFDNEARNIGDFLSERYEINEMC